MIVAIEMGLIYAIMALGVYLTFRILNFPDLTVDGSFTMGAAIAAKFIIDGYPVWLATALAVVGGGVAGWVTGLLHTKGRINGLLAGILTQIALYSINLRIMDRSNLPLLREETLVTPLRDNGLLGTWAAVGVFAVVAILVKLLLDWFLSTDMGLALRGTGDKEDMASSFGINTDRAKTLMLIISNALVGGSGALLAQYQGFADISMGIGLIVVGLASVILGQAVFGNRGGIFIATLAVVIGSVLYRVFLQLALMVDWLNPNDMKAISAALVVLALLLPQWGLLKRLPSLRRLTEGARAGRAA